MTQPVATRARQAVPAPLTARIRGAGQRLSAGFLAVFVAALLAFTWQSFVTQTHIHPEAPPGTVTHVVGAQLTPTQPTPERPIDCPICHAAALSGHYLTPGPALVLAPVVITVWRFTTTALAPSRSDRSHAWRSRAPPAARP
jgi:hypothetical protein